MYGLVNIGLKQYVVDRYGEDVWAEVEDRAGLDTDVFVMMTAYPDEHTGALLFAICDVLQQSFDWLLRDYGRHWIRFTAAEGYGPLMDIAGDDLFEFLSNLDNLHSRVGLNFPDLRPPSFTCTDETAESVRLHYFSEREGLGPLVVGCIEGLADRFGRRVEVKCVASRADGADHEEFLVTYLD
jgi:hypothetical protein